MDDLVVKYKNLNDSFKKEYIFHVGAEAGFYSELSHMIFAILYCLKYEYKFVLYSQDANFGFSNGWDDYFLPFCSESKYFIHRLYNKRNSKPRIRFRHYPVWYIYRALFRKTYLTYELWDKYFCKDFDNEFFDIPLLEIKGDLRVASAKIVKMIYRYNDDTINYVSECMTNISLPTKYISMQIRRGDKITECNLCPVEYFFEKAELMTINRNVFILADDYSIIEEIKNKYPNWNLYYLVEPSESGYIHEKFIQLSKIEKKQKLLKLFTSIEIVNSSCFFIGTYTTNVGLFLGMMLPFDKIVSVQKKEWFRFSNDDIIHQLVF